MVTKAIFVDFKTVKSSVSVIFSNYGETTSCDFSGNLMFSDQMFKVLFLYKLKIFNYISFALSAVSVLVVRRSPEADDLPSEVQSGH